MAIRIASGRSSATGGHHNSAVTLAWIAFSGWALTLIGLFIGPFVGGMDGVMIHMPFLLTFWLWSLLPERHVTRAFVPVAIAPAYRSRLRGSFATGANRRMPRGVSAVCHPVTVTNDTSAPNASTPTPARGLPARAPHAQPRGGRYYAALASAWVSFGSWLLALLLLVLALLAGGGYALMLPMLFVWTFWFWSLVGVLALLLTIGLTLSAGIRTLASAGIALHVASFFTVFVLFT